MNTNKKKTTLSRRNFLARGGGVLVPIVLSTACSDNVTGPNASDLPTSPRTIPPQPDPWPADPWQPDWQPEATHPPSHRRPNHRRRSRRRTRHLRIRST